MSAVWCRWFSLWLLLLIPPSAFAANSDGNPWIHSLYFENDLFNDTDRQYSNGVKYSIISPDLSPDARDYGQIPRRLLNYVHQLPLIRNAPPETGHRVEFSLGQNIYTPADTERTDLIDEDRPYAGWFYVATALHRKSDEGRWLSQMDTLELQLGVVGPGSYAEESQELIHRVRGLDNPKGWDNQLRNEPGLVLAYERKWLLRPDRGGWSYDGIGHAGGTLGNVSTYFNAGGEVRGGWNVPRGFGVSLIRPAGSAWLEENSGFCFYLFSAVNGKYVLRDIFLDGNSFRDSHSVDKRSFVADLLAGVAFGYDRIVLSVTQNFRTREFDEQEDTHSFGSIRLTFVAHF